jgi:hypothetical protein
VVFPVVNPPGVKRLNHQMQVRGLDGVYEPYFSKSPNS